MMSWLDAVSWISIILGFVTAGSLFSLDRPLVLPCHGAANGGRRASHEGRAALLEADLFVGDPLRKRLRHRRRPWFTDRFWVRTDAARKRSFCRILGGVRPRLRVRNSLPIFSDPIDEERPVA